MILFTLYIVYINIKNNLDTILNIKSSCSDLIINLYITDSKLSLTSAQLNTVKLHIDSLYNILKCYGFAPHGKSAFTPDNGTPVAVINRQLLSIYKLPFLYGIAEGFNSYSSSTATLDDKHNAKYFSNMYTSYFNYLLGCKHIFSYKNIMVSTQYIDYLRKP